MIEGREGDGLGHGGEVVGQAHDAQRVDHSRGGGRVAHAGASQCEGLAHGAGDDEVGIAWQQRQGAGHSRATELSVGLVDHDDAGRRGARVGYAAASPGVIDALRVVRLPYHLSAVTQAVALTALDHVDELQGQVGTLRLERDNLVSWLRERGVRAVDSDANFIMFGVFTDRHRAWQALLDRGVLVREVGPEGWLRVTVGTPEDNQAFRTALAAVLLEDGMMAPSEE